MAGVHYQTAKISERELNQETLMLGHGYDPSLFEGSVKPPVFLPPHLRLPDRGAGPRLFRLYGMDGRRALPEEKPPGLIYSRFNHANLEIVEDRLAVLRLTTSKLDRAHGKRTGEGDTS